jgi:hypothetical protein
MNKSAILSQVNVELKKDGNIEVIYRNVTADKFREVMENGMPTYQNTELICSFLKRLENLTQEYVNDANKLL